jgi:hypothetical protein
MASVRPVNRVLGFGIREMTPSERRPVAVIVVDVDLQQIQHHQLARQIPLVNIPLTSMNVLSRATKWRAPAKKLAPLMLRYRRWRLRMREDKKGWRPNGGDPPIMP